MPTNRGMIAFILTLGFITLTITACESQSERQETTSSRTTPSPTASMTPTASPTGGQAVTLTPYDREFMMDAARGGMVEVQLGNLATQKASNSDVKRFGERMATDHSQAGQTLQQLASNMNVTLPQELKPEQQQEVSRLQSLSGKEFDREYMKLMVDDHVKDLAEFERAASQATNPEVKQFASQTLPTLRDHLKQAREVAGKVGVKLPQSQ